MLPDSSRGASALGLRYSPERPNTPVTTGISARCSACISAWAAAWSNQRLRGLAGRELAGLGMERDGSGTWGIVGQNATGGQHVFRPGGCTPRRARLCWRRGGQGGRRGSSMARPGLRALRAFNDNYIWVLEGEAGTAVVVDPGDAAPVEAAMAAGLRPVAVLLTHHHNDHVGGAALLRERHGIRCIAPADPRIA